MCSMRILARFTAMSLVIFGCFRNLKDPSKHINLCTGNEKRRGPLNASQEVKANLASYSEYQLNVEGNYNDELLACPTH